MIKPLTCNYYVTSSFLVTTHRQIRVCRSCVEFFKLARFIYYCMRFIVLVK